jgi:hypothetical protein
MWGSEAETCRLIVCNVQAPCVSKRRLFHIHPRRNRPQDGSSGEERSKRTGGGMRRRRLPDGENHEGLQRSGDGAHECEDIPSDEDNVRCQHSQDQNIRYSEFVFHGRFSFVRLETRMGV